MRNASPSQMLSQNLGGRLSSVISLNSDSISLNAKGLGEKSTPGGDIFGFADRNINLSAQSSINLETEDGSVNLGTYVGDDKAGPAVLGNALSLFLDDILLANEVFIGMIMEAKAEKDIQDAYAALKKKIGEFRFELKNVPRFHSDKVYVPNRKDNIDDELDDLSLETVGTKFSNVTWEELDENSFAQEDIQEVDSPTATAGVRT